MVSTEASPGSRFRRSLAVVIGIDRYCDGVPTLRSAVADARALADVLAAKHGFEVWPLYDAEARLSGLRTLLVDRLPAALGPSDRLLLYFAGHGIALDGDAGPAGYLLPADAARGARETFLPMQELHDGLQRLSVRHALVILDCCFAGRFRWSSLRDIEPEVSTIYRERYDHYVTSEAWQVLTSASGDQLALDAIRPDRGEEESPHSPFARALLDGLAGRADYTGDNLVTADELAIFVRERVVPDARSVSRQQVPQLFTLARHDFGQFLFQVPDRALVLESAPSLDEEANPYRGLRSFREQDRAMFFGRTEVTRRLIDAVTSRGFVVVVGPSGCGKSSLVQAGVAPACRERGYTITTPVRPGRDPLAALRAIANELGGTGTDPADSFVAAVTAQRAPCLVVVDQLEELSTHRTAPAERAAFLAALARALASAPVLHLVVMVRFDAEPQLREGVLQGPWDAARFLVPGFSREELRDAIEKPATAAVLHFEPSRLVETLIDDIALVPAPLPILSFALSELYRACWARWQAGERDRALREADYHAMGGIAGALIQRATAIFGVLVAEDPAFATTVRNLFTRMVAVGATELARRRVPYEELVFADPAENRRVTEVLDRFSAARLIARSRDDGGAYVEPVHDELIRGWGRVQQWLEDLDRPAGTRALVGVLGDAVRSWRARDLASSYLWSDPRAEIAEALDRERPLLFNADESEFIRRSARIRRDRRARLVNGLLSTRRMLARTHVETGVRSVAFGPDGMCIVTASADGTARIWDVSTGALLATLGHDGEVRGARYSPDGARIVTASADGTARIWDARGALLAVLAHSGGVAGAAFSPDGTRVITASKRDLQVARIWNARTGDAVTPEFSQYGKLTVAAFHPSGTRVVLATADDCAEIRDTATGELIGSPLQHRDVTTSACFSSDGTLIATTSADKTARVWSAATQRPASPLLAHPDIVMGAWFSADGTRLVTVCYDCAVRVWDPITGHLLARPFGETGAASFADLALACGGTRIATTGNPPCIWELPLHEGTLAEWQAIAERSPYLLVDGVLSPRPLRSSSDEGARWTPSG
jgi:WD40 repeat protein